MLAEQAEEFAAGAVLVGAEVGVVQFARGQGGGVLTIGGGSDVADADISEVRIYAFWLPDAAVNSINSEMMARECFSSLLAIQ